MEKKRKILIISIIVVVVLIIIITTALVLMSKEKVLTPEEVQEKIEYEEQERLSELGEKERMEDYLQKYISAVSDKDYETAYAYLYNEFKEIYFPTLDSFVEYVNGKYPKTFTINQRDMERQGYYYIIYSTITNFMNIGQENNEGFIQNFIIKENGLNDFVLSFSV